MSALALQFDKRGGFLAQSCVKKKGAARGAIEVLCSDHPSLTSARKCFVQKKERTR